MHCIFSGEVAYVSNTSIWTWYIGHAESSPSGSDMSTCIEPPSDCVRRLDGMWLCTAFMCRCRRAGSPKVASHPGYWHLWGAAPVLIDTSENIRARHRTARDTHCVFICVL